MRCMLSVIITAFNVEKYLEQCVESVLNQNYKDLEIIIVNDGSQDNSKMLCNQFASKDSRIRVIHKENEGVIMARYDGVRIAKGAYVTFVDGDDWINVDMYEQLMRKLMNHNAEMIASGIIRYHSKDEKKPESNNVEAGYYDSLQINNRILPKMLWDFNEQSHGIDPSLSNKIFVKEKIYETMKQLIKKNYIFHYGEDMAILYPYILKIKSLIIVDEQYYFHRQRERNILASYLVDSEYFEKLFNLYQYLKEVFSGDSHGLEKQLEYFYMYSVDLRKKYYNDVAEKVKYMFPFDKVSKGSRVILYGAGLVGTSYYNQLEKINYCKIVLWVDRNSHIYKNKLYEVKDVTDIFNEKYDYIVLCNSAKNISSQIKEDLTKKGINETKIVY